MSFFSKQTLSVMILLSMGAYALQTNDTTSPIKRVRDELRPRDGKALKRSKRIALQRQLAGCIEQERQRQFEENEYLANEVAIMQKFAQENGLKYISAHGVVLDPTKFYLADVNPDTVIHVPPPAGLGAEQPALQGNLRSLVEAQEIADPEFAKFTFNEGKRCEGCGKFCAINLQDCNSCGEPLPVDIARNDNIMLTFDVGAENFQFNYKVDKTIPAKMSLRVENNKVFVYDDILKTSPIHINAVPKKFVIPNALWLFTDPAAALRLIHELEAGIWEAVSQFASNEDFVRANYKSNRAEDVYDSLLIGFNSPPSQFQLHVQVMGLMDPNNFRMLLNRQHATKDRFLPMAYMKKALRAMEQAGQDIEITPEMELPEVTQMIKDIYGVDYDLEWEFMQAKAEADHARLNVVNNRFGTAVDNDTKSVHQILDFNEENNTIIVSEHVLEEDAAQLLKDDDSKLHNLYNQHPDYARFLKNPMAPTFDQSNPNAMTKWKGL